MDDCHESANLLQGYFNWVTLYVVERRVDCCSVLIYTVRYYVGRS